MSAPANARPPKLSKSTIVRAGCTIVEQGRPVDEELRLAFQHAHTWRNAHLLPMRRVRDELSRRVRKIDVDAITAGRLKRFQSIRAKLKRGNISLYQMQDLAGVRAICRDMQTVEAVCRPYIDGETRHVFMRENDYLITPKKDGYRSRHIVLEFGGAEHITGGNKIKFELQVRTQLQHAWATAVEAVGLVRNENLKGGCGDAAWLRFFTLMSAEIAAEEGTTCVPGVPESVSERRKELLSVVDSIDAVATLESYNRAIHHTEGYLGLKGRSYVVQYDASTKNVSVTSYSSLSLPLEYIFTQEIEGNRQNTVIVEIDKVDDLRLAYPNYFLDVRLFTDRLKQAVQDSGNDSRPNSVAPEAPVELPPKTRRSKWSPFLDMLSTYPQRR